MKKILWLLVFACIFSIQSSSNAAVYVSSYYAPPPPTPFTNTVYYSNGSGFSFSIGTPYYRYSSFGRYMPPPPSYINHHWGHRPPPPPKGHHGDGHRPPHRR